MTLVRRRQFAVAGRRRKVEALTARAELRVCGVRRELTAGKGLVRPAARTAALLRIGPLRRRLGASRELTKFRRSN